MTPLVCVHGFLGGAAQWQDLAVDLGQDREVLCLDLPGFGANADLPAINRIGDFAQWVLDTAKAHGHAQFDLVGHSMGGMIVQEMVRRAPNRIRRLVLYGTGPLGVLPGRFEPIEVSMQRAVTDGAEATARRIAAKWFVQGTEAPSFAACAALAEQTDLPAVLAGLEAMRDWNGEETLGQITCPTLVLWGDRDQSYEWSQPEHLWRHIPDASLAVVPGCGHAAHLEKPELVNALLRDFLDADLVA